MDLRYYTELIWRWAWFIALLTILSGGLALFITRQITPQFESQTTFLLARRTSAESLDSETVQRVTRTYVELAFQDNVLNAIIERLKLPLTAEQLDDQIDLALTTETLLVEVTVTDTDPQQAANIANALVAILSERGNAFLGNDPILARLSIHVVEPATPSADPVSPRLSINLLVAVAVGGMLSIGIVLLADYLDDTLKTGADVARVTGLANLATILPIRAPLVLSRQGMAGMLERIPGLANLTSVLPIKPPAAPSAQRVVALQHPALPVTEEYRLLRTHIEAASNQQPIQTLVVLSSSKDEGKSLTSANLAVVLAQAGKRIILVDTDLRRPSLQRIFAQPDDQGVTTAVHLDQAADVVGQLRETEVANLLLLPAGPLPPSPADLLCSPAMARLIAHLTAHADMVIFDTPPLLDVTDATLLARQCDAALLVIRAGSTRADMVRAAQGRLNQFGIRTIGAVLNQATQYTHSITASSSAYGYPPQAAAPYRYGPPSWPPSGEASPSAEASQRRHAAEAVVSANGLREGPFGQTNRFERS